eukprot:9358846-Alexandrium_andersonii.AAC.1
MSCCCSFQCCCIASGCLKLPKVRVRRIDTFGSLIEVRRSSLVLSGALCRSPELSGALRSSPGLSRAQSSPGALRRAPRPPKR